MGVSLRFIILVLEVSYFQISIGQQSFKACLSEEIASNDAGSETGSYEDGDQIILRDSPFFASGVITSVNITGDCTNNLNDIQLQILRDFGNFHRIVDLEYIIVNRTACMGDSLFLTGLNLKFQFDDRLGIYLPNDDELPPNIKLLIGDVAVPVSASRVNLPKSPIRLHHTASKTSNFRTSLSSLPRNNSGIRLSNLNRQNTRPFLSISGVICPFNNSADDFENETVVTSLPEATNKPEIDQLPVILGTSIGSLLFLSVLVCVCVTVFISRCFRRKRKATCFKYEGNLQQGYSTQSDEVTAADNESSESSNPIYYNAVNRNGVNIAETSEHSGYTSVIKEAPEPYTQPIPSGQSHKQKGVNGPKEFEHNSNKFDESHFYYSLDKPNTLQQSTSLYTKQYI